MTSLTPAWMWTLSADDDGPPVREQARRLRLLAESYGLHETSGLLDAVMRRQEENLAETVARAHAHDASVTQYAEAAATWQRLQISWLRDNAATFGAALG